MKFQSGDRVVKVSLQKPRDPYTIMRSQIGWAGRVVGYTEVGMCQIDWDNGQWTNYTSEESLVHEEKINELSSRKGKFMQAVDFVKKQALKATNPNEYELREAGLHDNCGNLTAEGRELRDSFLEALVIDKLVETAKEINKEKSEKK